MVARPIEKTLPNPNSILLQFSKVIVPQGGRPTTIESYNTRLTTIDGIRPPVVFEAARCYRTLIVIKDDDDATYDVARGSRRAPSF